MYEVNDYIMYKHDACKVKEIKDNYYILVPISDESLTMKVPVDSNFIRKIINKEDTLELIDNIKNIAPLENLNDRSIENKYKELLNNGTHEDLIVIIKTCYLRNKERLDSGKKIGEKDKNYFEKAKKYLDSELCIALNKTNEELENIIFERCN